jgi:wyosine [tRNA(Phe)-imidazoG37] synthetase (radical SAM superfamily)
LRNEALAKDKILLSLVERVKSSEAKLSTQAEAHKAEVQKLEQKVAEATENFNEEVTKHEILKSNDQRHREMLTSFVRLKKNATMWLWNVLKT